MSIIFEALQKLKATSGRSGNKADGKSRHGDYTVGRALLSPKLILAVLLVVFAGGVLIMGAVEHLRVSLQERQDETGRPLKDDRQGDAYRVEPAQKNGLSQQSEGEMPPPPEPPENVAAEPLADGATVVVTTPGRLILPRKTTSSAGMPPVPEIDAGSPTAAVEGTGADVVPPVPTTALSATNTRHDPQSQLPAPADGSGVAGEYHVFLPKKVQSSGNEETASVQIQEEARTAGREIAGPQREALDDSGDGASSSAEAAAAEMEAETRKAEKAYQAKLADRSKMVRLVTSLRSALNRGEEKKTETLLSELTRIKGDDDPYVMKMKAYWHIRREEYAAAESLLQRCLAANDRDVEADLNMAVVESRTGKMEAARSRISRLAARYPNDMRIQNLRQTLK